MQYSVNFLNRNKVDQVKVKLDVSKSVIEYFRFQHVWENEKGATSILPDAPLDEEINIPLRPGERFQVISGQLVVEDEAMFYIADIIQL